MTSPSNSQKRISLTQEFGIPENINTQNQSGEKKGYGLKTAPNMLSTEEIILKNSLSLLDPIEITGILCFGFTFKDVINPTPQNCVSYPRHKSAALKNVFNKASENNGFDSLSENEPTPFLSKLYLSSESLTSETEDKGPRSYIITKAFGPRGLSAFFLLELKKREITTNNSVLEHVQQTTQTAFSKIVLLSSMFQQKSRLTPREKNIMKWIAYGKSNVEIAELMKISIHTVNGYLRAIYLKTQTSDRVSVSFYALHNGLLE